MNSEPGKSYTGRLELRRLASLIDYIIQNGIARHGFRRRPGEWNEKELADHLGCSIKTIQRWRSLENPKLPRSDFFQLALALWFGDSLGVEARKLREQLVAAYTVAQAFRRSGPKPKVPRTNFYMPSGIAIDEGSRVGTGIYLTDFDLAADEDIDRFVKRPEQWYLYRMFTYAAMFDFVSFQWSAFAKNPQAHIAALKLKDAFASAIDAPFRVHSGRQLFWENLDSRIEFFSGKPRTLESIAYDKSNAEKTTKKLDRAPIQILPATCSVTHEIAGSVARYLKRLPIQDDVRSRLLEFATPETYQTNQLIDLAQKELSLIDGALIEDIKVRVRKEYHRGNAKAADATCDFDLKLPSLRFVDGFARATGLLDLIYRTDHKRNLAIRLHQVRTDPVFPKLVGMFMTCRTSTDVDLLCDRLWASKRPSLQIITDWQAMWQTMYADVAKPLAPKSD